MNSKEYIIQNLNQLIEELPELNARYKIDSKYKTHIIEISPASMFYDNQAYREHELRIEDEFENCFAEENILFITTDSLNSIDNADFEFRSKKFNWINTIDEGIKEDNNILAGNIEANYALAA
jgi:hypothetical protein